MTWESTDSYIDDSLVNETASKLVSHHNKFGLTVKPPELLEGAAALGLWFGKHWAGNLVLQEKNEIPEVHEEMCRRELFSAYGKLVGHYPMLDDLETFAVTWREGWMELVEKNEDEEMVSVMREVVEEM